MHFHSEKELCVPNFKDPRIDFFDALAVGWEEEEPSAETMAARLGEQAGLTAPTPSRPIVLNSTRKPAPDSACAMGTDANCFA